MDKDEWNEINQERWRGEVSAKLDMLGETLKLVADRQERLSDKQCHQPCLAVTLSERLIKAEAKGETMSTDLTDLKATARESGRSWGIISGFISAAAATILSRLWPQ